MRRLGFAAVLSLGLVALTTSASLAIPIGQVNNRGSDTTHLYVYTNNGTTGTFDLTNPAGVKVSWSYAVPGTPFAGNTVDAILKFHSVNDFTFDPIFNQQPQKNFTFSITVDPTGNFGGGFGGKNLLSGSANTARIQSPDGGQTAQFSGSDLFGDNVVFSSDFLSFAGQQNFTWSYSEISGFFGPAPSDDILDNTTYYGNGNFRSDLATSVPEPGVAGLMFGVGTVASICVVKRRRA